MRNLTLIYSLLALSGCMTAPSKHDSTHLVPIIEVKDDHGRMPGCSWYCGAPPITVTASSTYSDGIYSYDASNIHDGSKSSVWAEGSPDHGVGSSITFTFDCTDDNPTGRKENPLGVDSMSVINGFARSKELWMANGRVKAFKVIFNGSSKGVVALRDTMEPQTVNLPDLTLPPGKKSRLTLEISEVYPGESASDTCISDIAFSGYGVH